MPALDPRIGALPWALPVTSSTPIDWVVQMRRLPEDKAMDKVIARGELADSDVTRVASKLAGFYNQLPPSLIDTAAYRAHIEDHVQSNRRELLVSGHCRECAT